MHIPRSGPKRATNVSLSEALIEEARRLGINVSQACERGLADEIARVRRERWLKENREAIDTYNRRVETEGLVLAAHRRF